MKRFVVCFFMALICGANVFGASGDVSRTVSNKTIEKSDPVAEPNRSSRRANVATNNKNDKDNKSVTSRTAVSRSTVSNRGENVASRGTSKNSGVVSRAGTKNTARSATETNASVVTRGNATGSTSTGATRRSASVMSRSTKDDTSTRQSGADNSGTKSQERATISLFKKQVTPTAESIAAAKDMLEKTADLNSVCQKQYNDCMDQFCAVVDANQKRCSCSDNLNKYAKVQKAVEDANAELNEVAQNIRYLGLSADEIRAIMNATEAELELTKTKDTSQTRSMLEDIADMIKDPTSAATSYWSSNDDSMFDLDFDFTSESSDLFSLDFFSSRTNDISSKRGKDLYNEATKRCKTVLKQCKEAGGTESQISGNYDLEISKDCVAYEQGLEKLNQTLLSNVRSANLMLQKGRLAVLHNKNQYDARGCIAALENCMLDEMVCGENYLKCLDPTKNYIDENGKVVLGRNITNITRLMAPNGMPDPIEGYNNTKITAEFIQNAVTSHDTTCSSSDGACIVNYLMSKIGTGPNVKSGGLCRAVLDKCQDYTYDYDGKTSTYRPYNEVIVNYIQRALVNIHAAQTQIISDYASTCMNDVSECYNQQVSQISSFSTNASANSVYSIMTGACYNVALTCGYAVFAYDLDVGAQVNAIVGDGVTPETQRQLVIIRAISDLFYQSLLCPSNSTFQTVAALAVDPNMTIGGYVNTRCRCNTGYSVWGGSCVPVCGAGEYRTSYGSCETCADGLFPTGSVCGQEYSYCGSGGYTVSCEGYGGETYDCSGVANSHSDSSCSYYGASANGTRQGCATFACKCNNGFTSWGGSCRASCSASQYANSETNGICMSCTTGTPTGGSTTMENNICPVPVNPTSCPEHSNPADARSTSSNGVLGGYFTYQGNSCQCESNYVKWGSGCISKCQNGYAHTGTNGSCQYCSSGNFEYPSGYNSSNSDPVYCVAGETQTCPTGSSYATTQHNHATNGAIGGTFTYNGHYCKCGSNSVQWNGACVSSCTSGQYHTGANGTCTTCNGELTYPSGESTGGRDFEATGCSASSNTCPANASPVTSSFFGVLHGVSGVIAGTFNYNDHACQCDNSYVLWKNGSVYSCVGKCTGTNQYHTTPTGSCSSCVGGELTYSSQSCTSATCEYTGCTLIGGGDGPSCEDLGAIETNFSTRGHDPVHTIGGYVTDSCVCGDNQAVAENPEEDGGYICVALCGANQYRAANGQCYNCPTGQVPVPAGEGMEATSCAEETDSCPEYSSLIGVEGMLHGTSGVISNAGNNSRVYGTFTTSQGDICQCANGRVVLYSSGTYSCVARCPAGDGVYHASTSGCATCSGSVTYTSPCTSSNENCEATGCNPSTPAEPEEPCLSYNATTASVSSVSGASAVGTIRGYVTENCICGDDEAVVEGETDGELVCAPMCDPEQNEYRDGNGVCRTCSSGRAEVIVSGREATGCRGEEQNSCPENSGTASGTASGNRMIRGFPVDDCQCESGYSVWNYTCVASCSGNYYRDDNGVCKACLGTLFTPNTGYESAGCCPMYSSYNPGGRTGDANRTIGGNVNASCKCDSRYSVWNGQCKAVCGDDEYRDEDGNCSPCGANQTATGGESGVMENSKCESTNSQHQ